MPLPVPMSNTRERLVIVRFKALKNGWLRAPSDKSDRW
jgi:hypothetical protein